MQDVGSVIVKDLPENDTSKGEMTAHDQQGRHDYSIDKFFEQLEIQDSLGQAPDSSTRQIAETHDEERARTPGKKAKRTAVRRNRAQAAKNDELGLLHLIRQTLNPAITDDDGVYIILRTNRNRLPRGWNCENRRRHALVARQKPIIEMELGVPQDSGERAEEVGRRLDEWLREYDRTNAKREKRKRYQAGKRARVRTKRLQSSRESESMEAMYSHAEHSIEQSLWSWRNGTTPPAEILMVL